MKKCCEDYLMEQFGDQDVANDIYAEYTVSIQEKITEAEQSLSAENWTTLDQVAHTVKGNALATGDAEMANVAIALRASANLKDANDSRTLIDKMKELATTL